MSEQATALGDTNVYDMWSDSVQDMFRIFVAECGEDPQVLLFVTDANGLFGLAVDTVRLMQLPGLIPSMLVVGVGYPTAATLIDTVEIRARDLTPTESPRVAQSGGADNFIRFIRTELWPTLVEKYPSACESSIYFGHSLGGLFGAYTMLSQPNTFDRYILSSPSLWWDDRYMFNLEQSQRQAELQLDTEVVIAIGSLETDEGRRAEATKLPEGHPAKPPRMRLDMVADGRRFASDLGQRGGLDLRHIEIADEFHATVPPIALNRALRFFYE